MRVAVVGGGIAGLSAASELADCGLSVTLLESSGRFGGQIATEHRDGFLVEQGAEGFIARSEAVPALCRRAGLAGDLVPQATRRTLGWRDDRLVELPPGAAAALLGIPADALDLGRGLLTLRGGMGDLIAALVATLEPRCALRPGTRVVALARHSGGLRLECAGAAGCDAEAVVLAIPPRETAALLAPIVEDLSPVRDIPLQSAVTVTLAFPREAMAHPLDASGLVVDGALAEGLRACTFSSSKFPGRAPEGWCLLRTFFSPESDAGAEDDDRWTARAHRVLAPLLGIRSRPGRQWVSRWPAALPRYLPAHDQRIQALRDRLRGYGPIELAGAAFDRGGIDGAVGSGIAAARRLVAEYPMRSPRTEAEALRR